MTKKQKQTEPSLVTIALTLGAILSVVFIWSVTRLAHAEKGVSYTGAPSNYSAIASTILLVYSLSKTKSSKEKLVIAISATILVVGYFVYLFGLS